jgi:outer membrane protein
MRLHKRQPSTVSFHSRWWRGLRSAAVVSACMVTLVPNGALADAITLREALRRAASANADLRIAQAQTNVSKAREGGAKAGYLPKVGVGVGYQWTTQPMLVLGALVTQRSVEQGLNFNDLPATDNLNVAGTVEVPLYAGGGNRAAVQATQAHVRANSQQERAVKRRVSLQVAQTYYAALKMDSWVQASGANVRALEKAAEIAEKRMSAGSLLRSDVLDIQVRLAKARDDELAAENAKKLVLRQLATLIGMDDEAIDVVDTDVTMREPSPKEPSDYPELRTNAEQKQAASAEIKRSKAGYLPHASALGTLAYDRGFRTGGDMVSYVAGVGVRWNAFDGMATSAKVAEAEAQMRATVEQERKIRSELKLELARARLALDEARQRHRTSQSMVAQAEESAAIVRSRFEQGLVLTHQLLEAESALAGARQRQAQAQADERAAIAALRVASGMDLWRGE